MAVDHCRSCLVLLTGSFSVFALVSIYSLAPESTRALTIRVLDWLSLLPAGIISLKLIIGLKCTCFSLLLDLVCLSFLLLGFFRGFSGRIDHCEAPKFMRFFFLFSRLCMGQ